MPWPAPSSPRPCASTRTIPRSPWSTPSSATKPSERANARRIFDRVRKTGNATAEQAFQNIDAPLAAGIERWKQAIDLGADNFSAHYELATLAEQRDELALAAEHYEKAWRLLPDRRSVLVDLGRVWKALDRTEDADRRPAGRFPRRRAPRRRDWPANCCPSAILMSPEFRHALELDPANVELRRELAYLLLRMNRQPEAEAEFRNDHREPPPDDLLSAAQLGFLLYARGEPTPRKPLFDRVLAGNGRRSGQPRPRRAAACRRCSQTAPTARRHRRQGHGGPQHQGRVSEGCAASTSQARTKPIPTIST